MSMSRRLPSRWGLVAAAVVLAVLVGGAFALGVFGGGATVLDGVPDDADYVATIDGAVVDDAETRELGTAALNAAGFESVTAGGALGAIQLRTDLALDGIDRAVVYGRYDEAGRLDSTYAAVIVEANWSAESVVDATTSVTGWEYDSTTVGDVTVYRPQGSEPVSVGSRTIAPLTIAALEGDRYAIGTAAAVEDAVAVANGDGRRVSGPLRETVATNDDGLVTVAADVSGAWTDDIDAATQGITRLDRVRIVAATYETPDESLRVRLRMHTEGTEAARDVTAFTRGGLPVLEHRVSNRTVARTLDEATVERAGTDVTVTVETTIADLRKIATHYGIVGAQP